MGLLDEGPICHSHLKRSDLDPQFLICSKHLSGRHPGLCIRWDVFREPHRQVAAQAQTGAMKICDGGAILSRSSLALGSAPIERVLE